MKIEKYFTTKNVIDGLVISVCLSAFIYFSYFSLLNGYSLLIINSFLIVYGLFKLIQADEKSWFFVGFFLAIFWFWWIGVSFYHYNLKFLAPLIIFGVGLIYGVIFLIARRVSTILSYLLDVNILLTNSVVLFLISYIEPFGFNWFKLPAVLVESIFSVEPIAFLSLLFILSLTAYFKRWWFLILLVFIIDFNKPEVFTPKSLRDIELVTTYVDVEKKWLPENQIIYTQDAIDRVKRAIEDGKRLIIFPESYLPYFLNLEREYLNRFLELSKDITIIIGSLYYKGVNNHRNSAYIIKDGEYKVANKVVLVPFGEANPLPDFLSKIINKLFFGDAIDYSADKDFTYIEALDKRYKIAICYEGTSPKTYEDKPKFLIVLSNNGWLIPSTEPTLQRILMKYYSKLYNTTIYHSINGSPSYIIIPF